MINKLAKIIDSHRLFINYAVIGVSGVLIDFAMYWALVRLGFNPIIASVVSVSAGIVNNFFWNAFLNFKKTNQLLWRFVIFYIIGATGIVLSALFIYILHDQFGVGALVAKGISVPFIVLFQYWFNKNASFAEDHRAIPWKQVVLFIICIASVGLFVSFAPYGRFSDEYDNLLGAQVILDGGTIYSDYFSHHMPLVYFLITPLVWIFGNDLIAIRVAFNLILALWLLALSRHIYKYFGLRYWAILITLITLLQIPNWSHMILAESIIQFSLLHALVLFLTRKDRAKPLFDILTYGILGALVALSSAPYIPLALTIYALGLIGIFENLNYAINRRLQTILVLALCLTPYVLLFGYLYFVDALHAFKTQALQFNTEYYSQFTPDAAKSFIDGMILIPTESLSSLYQAITFQSPNQTTNMLSAFLGFTAVAGVAYFYLKRQYLNTLVFSLAILLSASRHGFTLAFGADGGARSGTSIAVLCVVIAIFILLDMNKNPAAKRNLHDTFKILVSIFLLLAALMGASSTGNALRELQKPADKGVPVFNVEPDFASANTIKVVNTITGENDYYWVGHFDFASQLYIKANNASSYRFYLPWHSACQWCTEELISDLRINKPVVIVMAPYGALEEGKVWAYDIKTFTQTVRNSYAQDYYQLADPRLDGFYFRNDLSEKINSKLLQDGYDISPKELANDEN